ncbi:MAG: HEAT repeat domain-containing protein [Clostridiaceae bacterium]
MKNGLINIDWSKADTFNQDDVSYYLYLEGKSAEAISIIRNLDKETIQSHIINGKIKYGILAKCEDIEVLFRTISESPKADKIGVISSLNSKLRDELMEHIIKSYSDMRSRDKETAVWLLGELRLRDGYAILKKASVHNHVNIRRMAVSAMGKIGDGYFETALIKALDDENPQVVSYAIKALDKLDSRQAYDRIKRIYENPERDYLKGAAEKWLLARTL